MWQSYLKVEEKEHPLFCNKGIFNLKERASLLCEVRLLHSLYSISPTRRLIMKGAGEGGQCDEGYLTASDAG